VRGIGGGWYGGHGTLADRVGGTVWGGPLVGWFGVGGQHLGSGGGGKSVDCAPAGVGFGGGLCLSSISFELVGEVSSVAVAIARSSGMACTRHLYSPKC